MRFENESEVGAGEKEEVLPGIFAARPVKIVCKLRLVSSYLLEMPKRSETPQGFCPLSRISHLAPCDSHMPVVIDEPTTGSFSLHNA
jgi:hypothetical protein